MNRRAFIMLLGGAAAWPLGARAQQSERIRRIGFLQGLAESDPEAQARTAAFRHLAWVVEQPVNVELLRAAEAAAPSLSLPSRLEQSLDGVCPASQWRLHF